MIEFTEIQQHLSVPFEVYQKLPGLSTSFLKQEQNGVKPDFVMTDKVRVGSLVDSILTEPAKADMSSPLYPIAKNIAFKMKQTFGEMMSSFIPQVSYTAIAEHQGFKMRVRGRLDFLLPKLAVIDLKVTYNKDIPTLIDFMKYREQMFLYCKFAGVQKAYLLFYCVPKKTCTIHFIDCSGANTWWEEKIIAHGKVENGATDGEIVEPVKPKFEIPAEKPTRSIGEKNNGLLPNNDFLNGY